MIAFVYLYLLRRATSHLFVRAQLFFWRKAQPAPIAFVAVEPLAKSQLPGVY